MHTLVFTDKGEAFSFGSNKHGQLGTGSLRVKGSDSECAILPVKAAVTVWLLLCQTPATFTLRALPPLSLALCQAGDDRCRCGRGLFMLAVRRGAVDCWEPTIRAAGSWQRSRI